MNSLLPRINSALGKGSGLLILAGGLVILLLGLGILDPSLLAQTTSKLNHLIFEHFGRLYLWFALATLMLFPIIAFSPLGAIRLGGIEAKPKYSWFSWIAMLFTCGMGIGFMLWGAAEPLYHYMNPPVFGLETQSQREAAAFSYTFFHWGLEAWAIYGMTALVIGFLGFNLKRGFSLGAFLERSEHPDASWSLQALIRGLVDVVMVIAIIFGIAATLASGVLNVEGGLQALVGTPAGIATEILIMAVLATVYLTSAANGLDRGLKILSNISVVMSIVLLGVMIWFGPQFRILHTLIRDVPAYLQHIVPLSLGIGDFQEPDWLNQWTIKYWSWWISWAPFVGLFIATISRGRTIRELLVAVLLVPTLYSLVWFTVLGETAITLQEQSELVGQTFDWENVTTLLFDILEFYSSSPLLPWLGMSLIAIFVCNSADSASYIMACFTQQNIKPEGKRGLQLFWGLLFAALTLILLVTSRSAGYSALYMLQQINQITALPFMLLLALVFIKVSIELYGYWQSGQQR